jgi:hypothetical protein
LQVFAVCTIAAGSAIVSAQQTTLLPSAPTKQFGASVAPVYEGWWDNSDGPRRSCSATTVATR